MNFKKFHRNISFERLGMETDKDFDVLYEYLEDKFNRVDKYVTNNPFFLEKGEYQYGKGAYEITYEVHNDVLFVWDSIADVIISMISSDETKPYQAYEDIIKWWFDNKTDFEIKEYNTIMDASNSIMYKLAD